MGEMVRPEAFPVTRCPKTMTIRFAADTFTREFPPESLGAVLDATDRAEEMNELREIRNALLHRGTPGRKFSVDTASTGPSARGTTTWLKRSLTVGMTAGLLDWLIGALNEILIVANDFAEAKL
jgi:hypothetical protein